MEPAEITKVFPSGLTVSVGLDRDFTVTLMNLILFLKSYSVTIFLFLLQCSKL